MNKRLLIVISSTLLLVILGGFVLYVSFLTPSDGIIEERPGGLFPQFGDDDRREFFPEAIDGADGNLADGAYGFSDLGAQVTDPAALRQLWPSYTSGGFIGTGETGTVIRFVDRATGHIHETHTTTTKTSRITNTTIPKIQEVVWPTLNQLLIRYLRDTDDSIETFAATIVTPTATTSNESNEEEVVGELAGQFLPINILGVDAQDDGSLFYLLQNPGGGVRGIVSNFNGDGPREIFSSVVRDWSAAWIDTASVFLTSKAAAAVPGSALMLNTNTGSLTPILSNLFGLTTYAEENRILYSTNDGNEFGLLSFDQGSKTSTDLPLLTLPEKCVWSVLEQDTAFCASPKNFLGGVLPDEWYQGVLHFNDDVWRVNTETQELELLFDPEALANQTLDIIDLQLDAQEKHLFFRNKTDGTPWLFRLQQIESSLPKEE